VNGTSPKRAILDPDLAQLLRPHRRTDLSRNEENATANRESRNQKNALLPPSKWTMRRPAGLAIDFID
jgi:hypothetical protein